MIDVFHVVLLCVEGLPGRVCSLVALKWSVALSVGFCLVVQWFLPFAFCLVSFSLLCLVVSFYLSFMGLLRGWGFP